MTSERESNGTGLYEVAKSRTNKSTCYDYHLFSLDRFFINGSTKQKLGLEICPTLRSVALDIIKTSKHDELIVINNVKGAYLVGNRSVTYEELSLEELNTLVGLVSEMRSRELEGVVA